ncbi:MAG: TlpA disulfide reductase family protein [Singulisphaera sp.]
MTKIFLLLYLVSNQSNVRAQSSVEEYHALVSEYDATLKQYAEAWLRAKTKEEREKVRATAPKPDFQNRFMELARRNPEDSAAIDAIAWVFRNPWYGPKAEENVAEAIDILTRRHLESEQLGKALLELAHPFGNTREAGNFNEAAERLLRSALESNPHRKVQGQACYSLANYLNFHARHRSAGMSEQEAEKMGKEAEALFQRVTRQYADIKAPYRGTLGILAEGELFELWHLAVGKVAPEVEGEDIDGMRFKLSDSRGKVVVLTFSGNWCGPCRAMYPHERELVERLKDEPFALLSINTDEDKETLRKSIRSGEITWRCWNDGGTDGPTTTKWGIESFPTLFVLDPRGVIRYKGYLRGEALDKAVDTLLKEIETEKKP